MSAWAWAGLGVGLLIVLVFVFACGCSVGWRARIMAEVRTRARVAALLEELRAQEEGR